MHIVSNRKREIYGWLILITGIGVSVLTYFYFTQDIADHIDLYPFDTVYCLFNSLLIFFAAVCLLTKKIKFYNILSFILGLSVLIGLFIPLNSGKHLGNSLSIWLTFTGIFFGAPYGGFLWVPLFLFHSLYGLVTAITYWKGKRRYEFQSDIINQ